MMDFEISLVPDIKSEMLHTQRMRNFVVAICIFIMLGCAAVIIVLFSIFGGQSLVVSSNDNDIKCLSEGTGSRCGTTAIMNAESLSELLTIQDQMNNIGALNTNKIKFSRVFNVLDVLLPDSTHDDNGNDVKISELSYMLDPTTVTLNFDANAMAKNDTGYRALEAFKKTAAKIYFDYGNYMRYDKEADDFVAIPSFCIVEERMVNDYVYGVYSKGAPGCEAPMVKKDEKDSGDSNEVEETEEVKTETEGEESEDDSTENKTEETKIEYILIRRTYLDEQDREDYKNGKEKTDDKNKDLNVKTGYYFESECFEYDEEGAFDEDATLAKCPLLINVLGIGDNAYGKNEDGTKVLKFSATVPIDRRVFSAGNMHMAIYSPSRQNVTDSYIQIRNIFTKEAEDVSEDELTDEKEK